MPDFIETSRLVSSQNGVERVSEDQCQINVVLKVSLPTPSKLCLHVYKTS
ncbi:MAG: hypothetical protein ACI9VI_003293 [Candidatus Azotimanducaceae bacterium]|jgi:hypothetical protein